MQFCYTTRELVLSSRCVALLAVVSLVVGFVDLPYGVCLKVGLGEGDIIALHGPLPSEITNTLPDLTYRQRQAGGVAPYGGNNILEEPHGPSRRTQY